MPEKVLVCLNMLGCRLRAFGMKLWLKFTKYFCSSDIDFYIFIYLFIYFILILKQAVLVFYF